MRQGNCKRDKEVRYRDFRWQPEQVLWVLGHLKSMREGNSPFEKDDVPLTQKVRSTLAPFVVIAEFAADLDIRLEKAGLSSKLLEREAELGYELRELSKEARYALYYISGGKPKKTGYSQWKALYEFKKRNR